MYFIPKYGIITIKLEKTRNNGKKHPKFSQIGFYSPNSLENLFIPFLNPTMQTRQLKRGMQPEKKEDSLHIHASYNNNDLHHPRNQRETKK